MFKQFECVSYGHHALNKTDHRQMVLKKTDSRLIHSSFYNGGSDSREVWKQKMDRKIIMDDIQSAQTVLNSQLVLIEKKDTHSPFRWLS